MRTKIKPPKKVVFKKAKKETTEGPSLSTYDERPRISFTEKQMPDIKDVKLKEKISLIVEVEATELSEIDWGEDKGKLRVTFKVNSATFKK